MRFGPALSIALHTGILTASLIAIPDGLPEPTETFVPITLVTLSELETIPPQPVPKPPQPKPLPPPTPVIAKDTPEKIEPQKQPDEQKQELAQERLLANFEQIMKSIEKQEPEPEPEPVEDQIEQIMSPEEITEHKTSIQALIKARIERDCWRDPSDMRDAERLFASIGFELTPQGAIAGAPKLISPGRIANDDSSMRVFVQRAYRAIQKCAPYNYLPRERYQAWKSIQINFSGASK